MTFLLYDCKKEALPRFLSESQVDAERLIVEDLLLSSVCPSCNEDSLM